VVALVLALLCGTPSGWGADSTDCRLESNVPQNIVKARLYRAFCGVGQPIVLVDSLPATAGVEVCFSVDTTACVSYFISTVNAAGLESCKVGESYPRVVGVGYPALGPERKVEWIDATGRRLLSPPTTRGVYWKREWGNGKWRSRKIIVM